MVTTKYSHAFLVGSFNGFVKPENINKNLWVQKKLSIKEYEDRCSDYYKSHVDAMLEADGQGERPDFLKSVCHYVHIYSSRDKKKDSSEMGVPVQMNIKKKNGKECSFHFTLCATHLYFFPLDTVIVVIEIDDSGTELNILTDSHYALINWKSSIKSKDNRQLIEYLNPLADFLPDKDIANMIVEGTKMKMYQIVQTEHSEPDDALLYEIASFCPIGVVHGNSSMSPSKTYYEDMMSNYSISTFKNWKALALNDSFTMLSSSVIPQNTDTNIINGNQIPTIKNPSETWAWPWINLYFPLIYLRCVFEKTFCQSRNSAYRQNRVNDNLAEDILEMEKYYFYDNISYNFLPSLLYKNMSIGMGIPNEREAISIQIKERTKKKIEEKREKEERNRNLILAFVSVFAVFSIIWDLCQIVKDAFSIDNNPIVARGFIYFALLLIGILLYLIYGRKSKNK